MYGLYILHGFTAYENTYTLREHLHLTIGTVYGTMDTLDGKVGTVNFTWFNGIRKYVCFPGTVQKTE